MVFKLGLVGCGRISQAYLEALRNCSEINISAVMDVNKQASDQMAELIGCPSYQKIDSFSQHEGLDGAIICAPPCEHKQLSCLLMNQGISVLCEKPLAISVDEGEEMFTVAKKNNVVLMMASKFRYVEDVIQAKSMIASGVLGNVQIYQNQFCSKLDLRNRWNATPSISGGGVLIDNGTHALDLVHYLLGPIQTISVKEGQRSANLPVEESVMISFVTESQVNGTIHLSWSLGMHSDHYIEVYGNEGAVKLGWKKSHQLQQGRSDWQSFGKGYQKITAFKNQVENFRDAVKGIKPALITPEEGLSSLKLTTEAYHSLKSGKWEPLNKSAVYATN